MVDPIGLVGTLMGIVQVCGKLMSICYDYRMGVRDAPRDISRILDEVVSVGSIAQQLVKVIESDSAPSLSSLQAMGGDDGTLRRCLVELQDLTASLKLGKVSSSRRTLAWPLPRADAGKRLQVLAAIKSTLQLALAADNTQNIMEVSNLTRLLPSVDKKITRLSESVAQSDENLLAELLNQLGGGSQSAKQKQEYRKCAPATGDWLLNTAQYMKWKTNPNKILWIQGAAGCGKTVLCARIIKDLQDYGGGEQSSSLCYFFMDASEERGVDINRVYGSFIRQLIHQGATIPRYLPRRRRMYGSLCGEQQSVSLKELVDVLLLQFEHNYIVLDGLDECEEYLQDGFSGITELIKKMMKQTKGQRHLIVLGRNLEQLRNAFKSLKTSTVTIDSSTVNLDMQTALRHQFSHQAKFARWPMSLKKKIEQSLLVQANGSFRLMDCQLQTLRRCATPQAVQKALKDLPKSLEEHYFMAISKIDESNRMSVKNLLRWVAFALRPLSLDEVTSAIAINVDREHTPCIDEDLELLDPESFIDSCSSLVSTYCDGDETKGTQDVYIKLAHFTVREFLTSDAILGGTCSDFFMDIRLSHAFLASCSLAYFHHAVQSAAGDLWIYHPLARYAGHFWYEHKELSQGAWQSFELESILLDLFDEDGPYFRLWTKVANVDRPWLPDELSDTNDSTALYYSSYCGLTRVVKAVLDKGASPNVSGGLYYRPLQAAACMGHLEIVQLLIEATAEVNAKGGALSTALGAAAAQGHLDVAVTLLEAGANVNYPNPRVFSGQRSDPLFFAVARGHLPVCEALLNYGAEDYHHFNGDPPSALVVAVCSGRLDIVRKLLGCERITTARSMKHRKPSVIRSVQSGITAAQYQAAAGGHVEILRELLAHGITPDEALRYAARAGDEKLVRQYLDEGLSVDSHAQVSDHPIALQSAIIGGHTAIVHELLSRGADPNLESSFSTPLRAVVEAGNFILAQVLINAGARVDAHRSLRSALSQRRKDLVDLLLQNGADTHRSLRDAVHNADLWAFQLLMDRGADMHRQEPYDETSLLGAAAWGGSVSIVTHLLDNGLQDQLNPGPEDTAPLLDAVAATRPLIVELLIQRGADVNTCPQVADDRRLTGSRTSPDGLRWWPPDLICETALTLAVKANDREIAELLMRHGAMVTPSSPDTVGTPLLYAVRDQNSDLINALLDRGADPNQRGTIVEEGKPSFPLLIAAENGNPEIIDSLLRAGSILDDQDSEGFSALHVAAACRTSDGLKSLLHKHGANMNMRLLNGSLPIHSAASRGTPENLGILLDAGADINAINDYGRTPLHCAADNGNWEMIEALLERGALANVKSQDDGANTPVDMAYLAKRESVWASMTFSADWDDERIERLLQRLKEASY
ncbi:MOSC domain protein [Aspergillus niger]|nr:MOSC domain protein [Aspergillus niger]